METKEYLKTYVGLQKELQKRIEEVRKPLDEQLRVMNKQYLKEYCSVKINKVYEISPDSKGRKRHRNHYKRFVVLGIRIRAINVVKAVFIDVGGFWLNENSKLMTEDNFTVAGISNPTVLTLSTDQTVDKESLKRVKQQLKRE